MWKDLLFEYCIKYNKTPSQKKKYKNQNIGQWLQNQKSKIKSNKDKIYTELSENKYVKESLDNYLNPLKKWNYCKDILFEYCDYYKIRPLHNITYKNNNIGSWLQTQKKKIKSNTEEIYIKLSENKYVKQSLDKYLEYLKYK